MGSQNSTGSSGISIAPLTDDIDEGWDDDQPKIELAEDDASDRVTAVPDIPLEHTAATMMNAAADDDDVVPELPTKPPSAAPTRRGKVDMSAGFPTIAESDPAPPDSALTEDLLPTEGGGARAPAEYVARTGTARGTIPRSDSDEPVSDIQERITPTHTGAGAGDDRLDIDLGPPSEPAPALELADSRPHQGAPVPRIDAAAGAGADTADRDETETPGDAIQDMKDRYAVGDFTGALVIAESLLESDPDHADAKRYAQSCREVLTQMYAARLGALDQVATVAIPADQIRWLSLDHRAGFLLSLVDGMTSIEEILDMSGMSRLDALRIMFTLVQQRVISLQTQ